MKKVKNAHAATWRLIGAFLLLLFSYENIHVLHNILAAEVQNSNKNKVFLLVECSSIGAYHQISD